MVRTAEVAIIGGGVIGCSIAFHLARMGCNDVVVLEKDAIGSGATGKCAGGIRQQFSTETNIKLSIESVRFFERFENETGRTADFRQFGYLMLATGDAEMDLLGQNASLQKKLGVPVSLLSPQAIKAIVPQMNVDDVTGGTFCPTDGFADPYSVVNGFASAARRLGARIHQSTTVVGIDIAEGRVVGVQTEQDRYAAPVVVIAAGPHAALVGRMAGLEVPVQPHRRHVFVTEPVDGMLPVRSPLVIDFHNGFWFRREGASLIFGMRNPDEPEGFDTTVDWGFLSVSGEAGARRLPLLRNIGVARAQAGLHDDSPDSSAILGSIPGIDGLFVACGFSGHGFMHSPAVGKVLAELILTGESSIDVSSLSPTRFGRKTYYMERNMV